MIRPGPLSPGDAAYINDQLRELDVLRRQVQGMLGQAPELIPAAITSMTTVSWTTYTTNSTGTTLTTYSVVQHGWHEQGHNVQGTRVTLIGGRTGTNLVDPARLPNGATLATTITSAVPVWIRKVGLAQSYGMVHEIVSNDTVAGTSTGSGANSGCLAYNSADLSIPDTTFTLVTLDSEIFDDDSYHSTSSNTSRLTIPANGLYHFGFEGEWASSVNSQIHIVLNAAGAGTGAWLSKEITWVTVDSPRFRLSSIFRFTAGDHIEVYVRQFSGGNLNLKYEIDNSGVNSPVFWIHRC